MVTRKLWALLAALVLALTLGLVAGCGGDDEAADSTSAGSTAASTPAAEPVSGTISVTAVWSGPEQAAFRAVLDEFEKRNPDATVRYTSSGDQLPTILATAVEGGNPPDVAVLPQPGLLRQFANRNALQPIEFAREAIAAGFSEDWIELGTVDGQLYGLFFKGANKSLGWYNVGAFADAGVEPPTTFEELTTGAETLRASGVTAYSIGGADGWTLTDLFENIYLRQAGPEMYDMLAAHEIPWTHPTVKAALRTMGEIFSDNDNIAGGRRGALQADFPTSVTQVFTDPPKAAIVFEGDFVPGVITDSTEAQPGADFAAFAFPAIDGSPPAVVGGGDVVVAFRDTPAVRGLVQFLATPDAAAIWAARGGFASPNRNLDPSVYPDDITRETASALADAETFRFDLSDLQPAAFGGTPGQGLWKALQDFLARPTDVDGTATRIEALATRAFR